MRKIFLLFLLQVLWITILHPVYGQHPVSRERLSINEGWHFFKYPAGSEPDHLIYDVRPEIRDFRDDRPADAKPVEAENVEAKTLVLKPWILPSANRFIGDSARHHVRPGVEPGMRAAMPAGDPGSDFPFVQGDFDDRSWEIVDLPHDWAIKGPFQQGGESEVGGGMGRLPVNGVAWYRRKLEIPSSDAGKSIFLEVDGAMSYAMVWVNGHLAGGWPYGYASWQIDLTPYLRPGGENQLAIRLDNPNQSSRWYPGAGIYRNVWLTKTNPVHVGQWGTYITAENISEASATIRLDLTIDNDGHSELQGKADYPYLCPRRRGEAVGDPCGASENGGSDGGPGGLNPGQRIGGPCQSTTVGSPTLPAASSLPG